MEQVPRPQTRAGFDPAAASIIGSPDRQVAINDAEAAAAASRVLGGAPEAVALPERPAAAQPETGSAVPGMMQFGGKPPEVPQPDPAAGMGVLGSPSVVTRPVMRPATETAPPTTGVVHDPVQASVLGGQKTPQPPATPHQ